MEKITIKEAGRYANYLEVIRQDFSKLAYNGLNSKLIKRVETHKKSEAYKEAVDEVIEEEFEDVVDVEIDVLTEILDDIINEKILLANAIASAKKEIIIKIDDLEMDLDSSIEYAKLLRKMSEDYFYPLINRKEIKIKKKGTAYAFNVEGNQAPYCYNIEIEEKLKYNKADFAKKDKENKLLADKISQEVDKMMTSDLVIFEPKYSYLDSMEDIINNKIIN